MIRGAHRNSVPLPAAPGPVDSDSEAPGVRSVLRDLIELAELQTALFRIDANVAARLMTRALVLAVGGACLVLAAAPVALLALADWLHGEMNWSLAISRLAAAGVGLVMALVALAVARRGLRASLNSFQRSTGELSRNIEWLKHTLRERAR